MDENKTGLSRRGFLTSIGVGAAVKATGIGGLTGASQAVETVAPDVLAPGWPVAFNQKAYAMAVSYADFRHYCDKYSGVSAGLLRPHLLQHLTKFHKAEQTLVPLMRNLRDLLKCKEELLPCDPMLSAIRSKFLDDIVTLKKEFYIKKLRAIGATIPEGEYVPTCIKAWDMLCKNSPEYKERVQEKLITELRYDLAYCAYGGWIKAELQKEFDEKELLLDEEIEPRAKQVGIPRDVIHMLATDYISSTLFMLIGEHRMRHNELSYLLKHNNKEHFTHLAEHCSQTFYMLYDMRPTSNLLDDNRGIAFEKAFARFQQDYSKAFQQVFPDEPVVLPQLGSTPYKPIPRPENAVADVAMHAVGNAFRQGIAQKIIAAGLQLAQRASPIVEPLLIASGAPSPLALPVPEAMPPAVPLEPALGYAERLEIRREAETVPYHGK